MIKKELDKDGLNGIKSNNSIVTIEDASKSIGISIEEDENFILHRDLIDSLALIAIGATSNANKQKIFLSNPKIIFHLLQILFSQTIDFSIFPILNSPIIEQTLKYLSASIAFLSNNEPSIANILYSHRFIPYVTCASFYSFIPDISVWISATIANIASLIPEIDNQNSSVFVWYIEQNLHRLCLSLFGTYCTNF